MTVLVHASLSAIGWVVGGAPMVVQALLDVLGPDGTQIMPTFTPALYDPADWTDLSIPGEWVDEVRANTPAFDPARTPSSMGGIAEAFRTWPDVRRSDHPHCSFAAGGRHAARIVARHPLAWPLGDDSPLGRIYELEGWVLLLGVGYNRNSSLHLAETRAAHRRVTERRMPVYPDVADDNGRYFPSIGEDFERRGAARVGPVGSATGRLMSQRTLVDFAKDWLERELGN